MKQNILSDKFDAKSPAGADIRFLMDGPTGNMIHSTVPAGQINRATQHKTVSEFWFVLEGQGQIWRADGETSSTVDLVPGVSIDIPAGTAFQYRSDATVPLKFICISMPPWPGDDEADYVDGIWTATV
ncbi:cupin domain-containing protein [Roseibium sp.]|uniref:cupin domain-containing protein n=1 Tax=Roseibium sp. TaxID=1936156 RepID=UPI003BAC4046